MADDYAFMPQSQSEYAFPAGPDEADAAAQRNEQIQQAFDQQRFQRNYVSGIAKTIERQGAEIARLRQQKT